MKYLSLFSGIGGFELGIQQAYEIQKLCTENEGQTIHGSQTGSSEGQHKQLSELSMEGLSCIGFSEIDKYAIATYQKHFPTHHNYGDITKINADELPDFNLLVGGFPCQAFSIAGKRKGFEDTRGTLFFEIARILKAKQPRLFCLENVKGLLSHDNGNTFTTIISTLNELGYDLQWQVLNSKNHGVPQNRERVFIIGHLRGTSRPEVFPFGEGNSKHTNENGQGDEVAYCLQAGGDKHRGSYIADVSMMGHEGSPRVYHNTAPTLTQRIYKEPPVVMPAIRRLTPTECERLQGFPDGWTAGVSDTQRYKQCGNAVTVNVIRDIMPRLL